MDQVIESHHLFGIILYSSFIRTLWYVTQTEKTVFGQWHFSIIHNSHNPIQIISQQLQGNSENPPLGKMFFWERKVSSLAAQNNLSERIQDRFMAIVYRYRLPLTLSRVHSTGLYPYAQADPILVLAITILVKASLGHPPKPSKRDRNIRSFLTCSEWKASS